MKQWITDLLALQEVDLRIRGLETRIALIPGEIAKIDKDFEGEKGKASQAKETVMAIELEIKKKEAEIKEQNELIKKYQTQSAMIKKNDEYRAMMNEIEGVKNRIGAIETEELVLMEKIESARNLFKAEEKICKDREKTVNDEKNELKELENKIKAEIGKQRDARNELAGKVKPELLSIYARLLSKKTGIPFAEVHQGICGNCHLKLTPQTSNSVRKEVQVYCDNCGHLIYTNEISFS
jgi:predicted  nucleic acid-binding Zn-ribbon protein